jgi:hypothetical protein
MHLPGGHVAEVLRQAGLLHDDRRPAFDAWLDRKPGGVAAGIRRGAGRWLRTLKDGGPRSRPRRIATVHSHLGKALPALLDWPARYHHLREVTRDDIEDHVRGLHGSQRHNTLVALRSLFGFCLPAGVTFRNPTRGIKVGRRPFITVLQPLGQEDIDAADAAAATPAARLIVALAGVHAARSSTVCAMLLSDADPGSGRLLLGGRPRPLDDLTARLLRAWPGARRTRWPGTASPQLLINAQTALGTGPASRTWANSALRGHAATIEALRVDRQLEEAQRRARSSRSERSGQACARAVAWRWPDRPATPRIAAVVTPRITNIAAADVPSRGAREKLLATAPGGRADSPGRPAGQPAPGRIPHPRTRRRPRWRDSFSRAQGVIPPGRPTTRSAEGVGGAIRMRAAKARMAEWLSVPAEPQRDEIRADGTDDPQAARGDVGRGQVACRDPQTGREAGLDDARGRASGTGQLG